MRRLATFSNLEHIMRPSPRRGLFAGKMPLIASMIMISASPPKISLADYKLKIEIRNVDIKAK